MNFHYGLIWRLLIWTAPQGSWGAADEEQLTRVRRQLSEAATSFKRASLHITNLTSVHNLAVIHTGMDGIRSDGQKLASKLDAVLRTTADTAKRIRTLERRMLSVAADGDGDGDGDGEGAKAGRAKEVADAADASFRSVGSRASVGSSTSRAEAGAATPTAVTS